MISGISQGNDNSVLSMLRSMKKKQKEMLQEEMLNEVTPDSSLLSVLRSIQKVQDENLNENNLNIVAPDNSMQKEQEENFNKATPDNSSMQKDQEEENSALATLRATQVGLSSDVYSAGQEESKYISSAKEAFRVQSQIELTSYGVIADAMKKVLAANGVDISKSGLSERSVKRMVNKKVMEASKRNLDEIKDDIEQKAEESALPKNKNGQPIEGLPTESAGEATLMPEISGSNPAPTPVPEISAAPTPDVGQVATLISGVTSSFSSLSRSINIIV